MNEASAAISDRLSDGLGSSACAVPLWLGAAADMTAGKQDEGSFWAGCICE